MISVNGNDRTHFIEAEAEKVAKIVAGEIWQFLHKKWNYINE